MFRRLASLLIVSLGLALSMPAFACVQLEQSNCCPDKPPCGECPSPEGSTGSVTPACMSMPAPVSTASVEALRSNLSDFVPLDPPVLVPGVMPAPRHAPTQLLPYAAPPEHCAVRAGTTWLATLRLRL